MGGQTKTHYNESVEENGSKILKKAKGPECHLTITKETPNESIYLTHRVLSDTGATGTVLAEKMADVLEKFKGCPCWQHECKYRLWIWTCYTFRKKKKKNLHTIGCSLHQNELPFRAPQKAPLHSMVHWVNFVQMIAIIYPKNLLQLLRIPWSFILEWKIWIALVVTKDYSMNIQLVFLEVRWTLDLHRGKLVH